MSLKTKQNENTLVGIASVHQFANSADTGFLAVSVEKNVVVKQNAMSLRMTDETF